MKTVNYSLFTVFLILLFTVDASAQDSRKVSSPDGKLVFVVETVEGK